MTNILANVLVLFGGGQTTEDNKVLSYLITSLIRAGKRVYGLHKSFMGMTDIGCYELMDIQKATHFLFQRGTYFGTCRNVRLTNVYPEVQKVLEQLEITTIYIVGGDGSLRASAELLEYFGDKFTIKFIPTTVDGINGSDPIGFKAALAETHKITDFMATDCFSLYDANSVGTRVAIVEVQGRNRNDLLVGVAKNILKDGHIGNTTLDELNLIVLPCGYKWKTENLLARVNESDKNTLVLVSEGAIPDDTTMRWWFDGASIGLKVEGAIRMAAIRDARTQVVGYLTQMNDAYSPESDKEIRGFVIAAIAQDGTGVIAKRNGHFETVSFKEMVELNQNSSDPVCITANDAVTLQPYLV